MHNISTELKVPFHDVDPMQVVWHGHYIKYLEIARCQLLDELQYNYEMMRESGYAWPVIDLRLKYVKPALFGDVILVQASVVEYEYRLKISYEITRKASGERLAKGYTCQVAVDLASNEMCFESPADAQRKLSQIPNA